MYRADSLGTWYCGEFDRSCSGNPRGDHNFHLGT